MSQVLTLELSDDEYQAVEKAAKPTGQRPAEWAAMKLRQQLSAPRKGSPSAILQAMSEPPHSPRRTSTHYQCRSRAESTSVVMPQRQVIR